MIVGISGKKQSGKSTIGKIIHYLTAKYTVGDIVDIFKTPLSDYKYLPFTDETSWEIKQFAGKLKEICSLLTGIPVEDFEKEKVKASILGEEWDRWRLDWYDNSPKDWADMRTTYHVSLKECLDLTSETEEFIEYSNHKYTLEKITVRQALQWIGTDLFRDKFHPQTWVNALMKDYKPLSKEPSRHSVHGDYSCTCSKCKRRFGSYWKHQSLCEECYSSLDAIYPNWLITDVRFPNEAKAIKDRGGIILRVNRSVCPKCGEAENFHWDFITHAVEYCNECGYRFDSHLSETALDTYEFDYIISNDSTIDDLITKIRIFLVKFNLLKE